MFLDKPFVNLREQYKDAILQENYLSSYFQQGSSSKDFVVTYETGDVCASYYGDLGQETCKQ